MRVRILASAALLLLASCDGGPSSSGDPTPTVSFRYGGALGELQRHRPAARARTAHRVVR